MPHFRTFSIDYDHSHILLDVTPLYSVYEPETIRGFTAGEDAHDGYPGGRTSSTEVHGSGGDDEIDHSIVGIAQSLYGFAGDDTITAGYADDTIVGGLGDDSLFANAGDDVLDGGDGNDFLSGDAGNDSIHTGDGIDSVFGGEGDDFIFLSDDGATDTVFFQAGEGQDVIDNFEHGVDKVALSNLGIASFAEIEGIIQYSGDQALVDFGNGDVLIFTGLEQPLTEDDFLI